MLAVLACLGACKRDGDASTIAPDRQADAAARSSPLPSLAPPPAPSSAELAEDEPGCLGGPPLAREGVGAATDKERAIRAALAKGGLKLVEPTWSQRLLSPGAPKAGPAFVGYADTAGIVHVDGEERAVACASAPSESRELFARDAKGDVVRVRLDPAAVRHWRPVACGCHPEAARCAGQSPAKVQDVWTLPAGAAFAGTVTIRAEVTEFEPIYRTKGCAAGAPTP